MKIRIIPWIIIFCGLVAIGVYIADLIGRMNTVSGSIIGGADSPTFLYLVQSGPSWLAVAGVALLVIGAVLSRKK